MTIIQSSLKIKEAFNNCPGKDIIQKMLDDEVGKDNYMFVDLVADNQNMGLFKNDLDSVVIMLTDKKTTTLLGLTTAVNCMFVDEFHWVKKENNYIVKLWWD